MNKDGFVKRCEESRVELCLWIRTEVGVGREGKERRGDGDMQRKIKSMATQDSAGQRRKGYNALHCTADDNNNNRRAGAFSFFGP